MSLQQPRHRRARANMRRNNQYVHLNCDQLSAVFHRLYQPPARSGPSVSLELSAVTHSPPSASGCQGLSRHRRSTPGQCCSQGRSLAALVCPPDGRSFHATIHQHWPGLRPDTRCRHPVAARTPLARREAVPPEIPSIRVPGGYQLIHLDPIAFSGMCDRHRVARLCAFCFYSPISHDAMDFVDSSSEHFSTSPGDHQVRWIAVASVQVALDAPFATVPLDSRSEINGSRSVGPSRGDSRRHAASLRDASHSTCGSGKASTSRKVDSPSGSMNGRDALGRHPEGGPDVSLFRELRRFTGPSPCLIFIIPPLTKDHDHVPTYEYKTNSCTPPTRSQGKRVRKPLWRRSVSQSCRPKDLSRR